MRLDVPPEDVRVTDDIVVDEENKPAPRHPDPGIPGLTEASIRLFDDTQ
jgi:hypothetical protein